MTLTLPLLAVAFFIPTILILVISLRTFAYVYKIHMWHMTCKRIEQGRDNKADALLKNQEDIGNTLRYITNREEKMLLILANLTDEVLSLAQERHKRASVPPDKGN